jgi:hypothetical protein
MPPARLPMPDRMSAENLALVRGMDDTRAALRRWNAAPLDAIRPWFLGAAAIAIGLLGAVWLIAHASTPDTIRYLLPGINAPTSTEAVLHVLFRNSLVLALHSFACIAGFIAGSSLPMQAEHHSGWWRTVHEKAGPAAIAFVAAATTFSLATQAYILGASASTIAAHFGIGRGVLILTLLPHALPELTALFLPLAAWLVASRRGRFDELLAATIVTVAIAVPVLVVAAVVEVYVWPDLLRAASPLA